MSDHDHLLSGIDGSNPLGFLAAIGALVALDGCYEGKDDGRPRLSWVLEGVWRPRIHTQLDRYDLLTALDGDRQACRLDAALNFTYPDAKGKPVPDLKARPIELRETLLRLVEVASPASRRALDWFTGFLTEGAVDNNGAAKPTALHFTAGQQKFLAMALQLVENTSTSAVESALFGPWTYDSVLPVMGWDNTETRDYALRRSDPSNDKKTGNPGADWLALRALGIFTVAAVRGRTQTPGVKGGWKNGAFAWPLWTVRASKRVCQALVMTRGLRNLPEVARHRRGIAQVFEVSIRRSDQGGYGSMTPARVL